MNGNDQHLGDELGQHLRHRVDGLHDAPLTLGDVQGRARTIRRNRWVAGAASVAAAVAIIVPVTIFAGQDLTRSDAPTPGPATSSPSGTPTRAVDPEKPTEAPSPRGNVGTLSLGQQFPGGAAPTIPFLDGDQLTRPDGTTTQLPQQYNEFVTLGEQILAIGSDDGGNRFLDLIGPDGSLDTVADISGGLAVNTQRTSAAWATTDGDLMTIWSGGQVSLGDQGGPVDPVAISGDGSCLESENEQGCTVFYNREGEQSPRYATSHGIIDDVAVNPTPVKVNDVDARGNRAVQTTSSIDGSCSGVFGTQGRYRWKTCDYSLERFSPGGGLISAPPAYRDGLGDGMVSVLDATTGEPVLDAKIDRGFVNTTAWEDDAHLLVVVYDADNGWRILRVGVDGSVETAAGPVTDADEMSSPFVLEAAP